MTLNALAASTLGIDEGVIPGADIAFDWENADHIDLLLAVEVTYEVQFSIAEIRGMQTLADMRTLLTEKGASTLAA